MYRSFTYTIAALFLMVGMAGSASASQILSVEWDVTSGSITGAFFGMESPITSGTVKWTAPTATAIFTPVAISGGTGTLKIDLYTASNSFHAEGLGVTGLTIDAQNFFASFVLGSGEAATFSGLAPLYNFSGFLQFIATGQYGSGSGTTASSGSLFASFVLGNEVRTYMTDPGGNGGGPANEIPEPTAALAFGVGFSLVALYTRKLRMSA